MKKKKSLYGGAKTFKIKQPETKKIRLGARPANDAGIVLQISDKYMPDANSALHRAVCTPKQQNEDIRIVVSSPVRVRNMPFSAELSLRAMAAMGLTRHVSELRKSVMKNAMKAYADSLTKR